MRCLTLMGVAIACLLPGSWPGFLEGQPDKEITPEKIASLVKDLGDDEFNKRQAATDALATIGEPSLAALKKAFATTEDLEVRRRSQYLIRKIMLDCRKSKTLGLKLEVVDAGEFDMGSNRAEVNRRPDETDHKVRITQPFLMGIYEVTQDEYEKLMKVNPSWFSKTGGGKGKVPGQEVGKFPVDNVSWFDAVEFCNRLSKEDGYEPFYKLADVKSEKDSIKAATVTVLGGNGYRLPTEAEWEFACRAGAKTPYHYGGENNGHKSNVKGQTYSGGYGGTIVGPNLERTARVGTYPANALGLFDMHGNVGEWCTDWYDKDYYANSPEKDPKGPDKGTQRVIRGGSWLLNESSARSASRFMLAPEEAKDYTGFRVARTP
jgi:formylglycine-generating enzyme required for sulfatase activity